MPLETNVSYFWDTTLRLDVELMIRVCDMILRRFECSLVKGHVVVPVDEEKG